MAIAPGTVLGSYEIRALIGAGGMGEVYRAHDGELGREVAIKVLPTEVADDPSRLARLRREARILASLSHPNIAAIYGLADAPGVRGLVLELVEGTTLEERLQRGPLSTPEALGMARQICQALEAAHERDVIHRDLKPANVKVRPDGTVKVLDFGLAKALAGEGEGDLSQAPTMTAAETQAGTILGTAAFMSPEQARGQALDRRADIWAFGCVLYQMLTARRAFEGNTLSDVLAAVLGSSPDWSRLPSDTPVGVRRLLRRCLAKDPKRRLRDFGDALLELDEAVAPEGDSAASGRREGRAGAAAAVVVTAVVLALGAGWLLASWFGQGDEPARPVSFSYELPGDRDFTGRSHTLLAISADGSFFVYVADGRVYRRALSDLDATPIRGTDGHPLSPFLSPDGRSLGYWDETARELRRIDVSGGVPVSLARTSTLSGAHWNADEQIVYGQADGIWRVPASGGTPERIVEIEATELVYGPQVLPGGETVLFSLVRRAAMVGQSTAWDLARVVVQSLGTGERQELVRGSDARYLPTGHLAYALDDVLFAVPFDLSALEVRGAPVPVVEGVERAVRGSGGEGGGANYAFSRGGTLVYVPATSWDADIPRRLVAVDFEGNTVPLIAETRNYWRPRVSPDGTRVAVEVLQGGAYQVWTVDLERRTATPLTFEGENAYPLWTPDGHSLVHWSGGGRVRGIYRRPADGTGAPELLEQGRHATDISPDGILAFLDGSAIRALDLDDGTVSDLVEPSARAHMARFSPDGRWLAYTSNLSGQDEIYVRPFPRTPGVGRLVSVGGGAGPVWAPDGSALYYRGATGNIMAVPTSLSPTFAAGRPEPLFRFAGEFRMSGTETAYDIHPDGTRFIMVTGGDVAVAMSRRIVVVLNWFDELATREAGEP